MKKNIRVFLSAVVAAAFLAACNKTPEPTTTDITPTVAVETPDSVTPTETPAVTEAPTAEPLPTATPAPTATPRPDISGVSLKELYKDDFMIGTIYTRTIDSGKDNELIKQHFNVITPENLMKPEYMQRPQGTFNFGESDHMMSIAERDGLTVIGHTLAWHNQSGDFLGIKNKDGNPVTRDEAIQQLKDHIYGVAGQYKGKIHSWDVLNEAVQDGAKLPADGDWTKCLRETQWTRSIGPDYVAMAFRFAHEADPDALLYYNDYNLNVADKAEIVAAMVSDLRSQGVPIHGIGMQGHYSIQTGLGSVRNSLKLFSQIEGIVISVTELDVGVPNINGKLSAQNEKKQALYLAKLFNIYKEYADVIERVTFWGYRDDTSWRSQDCPLLFNKDLTPKEAFYALLDTDAYIAAAAEEETVVARRATAKYGTPEIDGTKDALWLTDSMPYSINTPLFAWQGATGTVRALWDEKYIYALFEIEDNTLNADSPSKHEQDSVELFLDEENMKEDYFTDLAGQYRVNYKGELSFGTVPTTEGVKAAASQTAKGYIIEIAIPLKNTPVAGKVLGFEAQINDSNAMGVRQSVMKFNDTTDNSYMSTSLWGELLLK